MSKKFVLVPQDLFNAYIQSSKQEEPPILEKVLHDKSLDPTSKKELYNQHWASWLKHKRLLENRPVPVRVARDTVKRPLEIRVKRKMGHFIETPYAYPTPPGSRSPSPGGYKHAKAESDTEFESAASDLEASVGSAGEYSRREEKPDVLTPRISILDMPKSPLLNPKMETPYEKKARAEINMKKRQFEIKTRHEHAKQITNTIMRNPGRYGATKDGEIINERTGRAYHNARKGDVKQAILKMLGSAISYEPAGYKKFKERVEEDEGIRSIIDSVSFTPERWV